MRFFKSRAELRKNETLLMFKLLFRQADRKMLAERLKVSEKQVQRYLNDESEPGATVLKAMLDLVESQKDDLAFIGLLDRIRAEAQEEQRKNPHIEIEGVEERDIPDWYRDVRTMIAQRDYDQAYAILENRTKYQADFNLIPKKTQPYVLGSFGITLYYRADYARAAPVFERALNLTREIRNDTPAIFLATYTCNLGLAHMRQSQIEMAFIRFDEAAAILPSFIINYYNAICAASALRNEEWIGHWAGRLAGAAPFATSPDIKDVLEAYKTDSDLDFARECDTFAVAMNALEALYRERLKGK
jgi:tetratricopeptide (TPR) repeat protein